MKKLLTLICSLAFAIGSATDSSAQAVVELVAIDAIANEGAADTATFELRRTGGSGDIVINLGIVDPATDVFPGDYSLDRPFANIVIPEDPPFVTITVTAIDDVAAEADEALSLELLPSPGYAIGVNNRATVTISANDFVVTNPDDFAAVASAAEREGTLRQAIENANAAAPPQTVTFSDDPFFDDDGDTISITGGEIIIRRGLTIAGPGAKLLTIEGINAPRIFRISDAQGVSKTTIGGISFVLAGGFSPLPASRGGAIFVEDGPGGGGLDLTLTECAFSGNSSGAGAGLAFDNSGGTLLIERCVFEGNQALQEGGALTFDNGDLLRITDSTFASNFSNGRAGAILVNAGMAEITNTTIVGNHADEDSNFGPGETGGGLWVASGVPCLASNSLIAGNSRAPLDRLLTDVSGILSPESANNLISDPATSGGLSDGVLGNIIGQNGSFLQLWQVVQTDRFDRNSPGLADNGGPTMTVRLTQYSPAVDAGNDLLVSPSGLDQRGDGFPRSRSGFPSFQPDPGVVDIGAIEFDPILVTTTADENDPIVDPSPDTSLREAIALSNQKPGDDLIVFSRGFNNTTDFYDFANPKTITAELGEFLVTDGVEIDGPGAGFLTLSGDIDSSGDSNFGDTRIFHFPGNGSFEEPPRSRLWGMTLDTGSPQITDVPGDGGAILIAEGVLEIFDVEFRNNAAQRGGAIFSTATVILDRVTLEGNEAFGEGGAIYAGQMFGGGTFYSYSSTFLQNMAAQGGAIFAQGGLIRIFNSTFSSNNATEGGGLYYTEGDVQITNSTIAENLATSDTSGGGIDLSGSLSTPSVDLDNTIVAANTAGGASPVPSDIGGIGIAATSFSNFISDAASAGGLTDGTNGNFVGFGGAGTVPLSNILEPLDFNGGLTQTYHPIEDSPVIDSGDNASAVYSSGGSELPFDQRDLPRIVGIVDIGSVEVQSEAPILDPIGDIPPMFELELLRFTATATVPDGLAEPLFSLEDGFLGAVPAGASIDPISGEFEWTPDESDGPGFFEFDLVVSRDDDPNSTTSERIFIEVLELNEQPTLGPIPDQTVGALSLLTFTASASDPDDPANTLTFRLDAVSLGLGMTIDPASGVFQWTPASAQAPAIYPVTVSVSDDGDPTLSDSQNFNIQVTQSSLPVISLSVISGAPVHEPDSYSKAPPAAPPAASFQLGRSDPLGGDIPVTLRIENTSQAAYGSDFVVRIAGNPTAVNFSGAPLSATITIPDDEPSIDLLIDAVDDAAAEADEIIYLAISPQIGYNVGAGELVQVIAQNDYGVTNLGDFNSISEPDGGEGTLRRAVDNAKAGLALPQMAPQPADITFDPALLGTIPLTGGALELDTADFSISGPGASVIGVSANQNSRVFVAYDPNGVRSYRISGLGIADGLSIRNGGGIFNSEILTLEDCVISGCLAENGGGITNEGELTMDGCLVTMNGAAVYGGGIDNFGGIAVIHHSTISGNSANFGGGLENSTGGMLRIESSTIAGNEAMSSGGGIDSFTAMTSASNLTVSGNMAGFGAGLFNEASSLTIVQSTIAENVALSYGGGIVASSNAPAGNTVLHNSIVAGNTEGGGTPSDVGTGNNAFVVLDPSSNSNLIGDATSSGGLTDSANNNLVGLDGSGQRPLDEIVSPLADNGGPTATHALAAASLAVDAGDNASALDTSGSLLINDQRGSGFLRIVSGTVDIGAFELAPLLPKMVSCEVSAGPEATVTWESEDGEVYDVFCSSDLIHWLLVGTGIPATGELTSWTDVNPPAQQAYFIVRPAVAE